jgi:hypothetical protein
LALAGSGVLSIAFKTAIFQDIRTSRFFADRHILLTVQEIISDLVITFDLNPSVTNPLEINFAGNT